MDLVPLLHRLLTLTFTAAAYLAYSALDWYFDVGSRSIIAARTP